MARVIVVADDVAHDHGGHEAHGVTQSVYDPHQCPGEIVCNILEHIFKLNVQIFDPTQK